MSRIITQYFTVEVGYSANLHYFENRPIIPHRLEGNSNLLQCFSGGLFKSREFSFEKTNFHFQVMILLLQLKTMAIVNKDFRSVQIVRSDAITPTRVLVCRRSIER